MSDNSTPQITIDRREYDGMQSEIARLRAELEKAERERDEAQRNHVSAVQREVITGGKLFDRETRLTTLAKELGRVQGERDAEVDDKLIAIAERDEARKWARYFYELWNAAEKSALYNLNRARQAEDELEELDAK